MRRVAMRRLLTALFLSLTMTATAYPASAGGWGHYGRGHGGYHHGFKGQHYRPLKRHHYYRHYGHNRHHKRHGNDDFLLGAGIIGGAIIVGSVLSRPQPTPPPVYYAPPRPQSCVQDQVYRYLPDGRVQWGTRTRCY